MSGTTILAHAHMICSSLYVCVYMHMSSRIYLRKEEHGTAVWGPVVALSGKRDRKRTSNDINTHDVPHFLFVQAWID